MRISKLEWLLRSYHSTPQTYHVHQFSLIIWKHEFVILSLTLCRDTTVAAADGTWHHICATWENNAGSWQLFKDGVLKKNGQNFKTGMKVPVSSKIFWSLCHFGCPMTRAILLNVPYRSPNRIGPAKFNFSIMYTPYLTQLLNIT